MAPDKSKGSSSCPTMIARKVITPIGTYAVSVCEQGVHSIQRLKGQEFKTDLSISVAEKNPITLNDDDDKAESESGKDLADQTKGPHVVLRRLIEWFHFYFSEPSGLHLVFPRSVQICVPSATQFQRDVWNILQQKVGFGETTSYGDLAALVGRPRAARAVGSAMKNNPNAILVPCHRVIRASSDMGNYNGGVEIKKWLLSHEQTKKEKMPPVIPKP